MVIIKEEHSLSTGIWTEFEKFIIGKGITSKYSKFYIMWAKKYVRYNNNEIPPDITKSDIKSFKTYLTADSTVMSWQLEQALKAVTLFRGFLASPLHKSESGNGNKETELSFKDSLSSDKTDLSGLRVRWIEKQLGSATIQKSG